MVELGVNIDHVATVRQARRTNEPDPVWAATLAQLGGADGITLHLREDRRHISDRDLRILRQTVTVKLNFELACNAEVVEIACETRPDQATLVPEKREEVTTEGGLDLRGQRAGWPMPSAGCKTPEFGQLVSRSRPERDRHRRRFGADAVELHTGEYAAAATGKGPEQELDTIQRRGQRGRRRA